MNNGNDKKGLIGLVVILSILVVGLSSYLIYDKLLEEDVIDNNNDDMLNTDISNIYGHVLSSQVGSFIVDEKGEVYYVPYDNWNLGGNFVSLKFSETTKNILGVYGTYYANNYDINPSTEKDEFNGYKLNLSNIKSANQIYFGNGDAKISIIFINNDGKISELIFEFNANNNEYTNVKIYNEVENYNNIVSVIPTSGFSGSSAILIDRDGNQYKYYGAGN